MTTFDKRKDAFEAKFAHDEELQFKADARRNMLLGLWAAGLLGKTGADAEAYAKEVVAADFEQGRRGRRLSQDSPRFRCCRRPAVRPSDPPDHGRADARLRSPRSKRQA